MRSTGPMSATSSTNASGTLRRRLALLAAEEQILDLACLRLVAVAREEVVVEVLPARAHAADVERVVLLQHVARRPRTSSVTSAGTDGAMSNPSRARSSGNTSRACSGDQKIGSQPSAISNVCSTAFGPIAAR